MTVGSRGFTSAVPDDQPLTWDDISAFMAELKGMARGLLSHEGNGGAVKTTGLVLSALRRQRRKNQQWEEVTWANRHVFFGCAYRAMRHALVDYARKRQSEKQYQAGNFDSELISPLIRDGSLNLDKLVDEASDRAELALALESSIEELDAAYPAMHYALILEHYCFGGFTLLQTAKLVGINEKTVRTRLAFAYAHLRKALALFFPGISPDEHK